MKILVINEYSKAYTRRYPEGSCIHLSQEEQLVAAEISGDTYTSIEEFQDAFNEGRVTCHESLIFIKERKYFLFGDEDTKIAYFNGGMDGVSKLENVSKAVESFYENDVNGIAGNAMVYGWYLEITKEEYEKYTSNGRY